MSLYHFIAAERGHYPVRRLCQVPASGFCAWQACQQPAGNAGMGKATGQCSTPHGTRRLQVVLRQKGHRVGR